MASEVTDKNRRFYDEYVADLIHAKFVEYEDRIAVGIAGEGSDCFGYDDLIRNWLTPDVTGMPGKEPPIIPNV